MRQRSRLRLRPAKRYVTVRAVRITDPRQTEVSVEVDGSYVEKSASGDVRARNKLETAEISLNDCLACSGCVTSAESVLVGMQSIDQVTTALREQSDKLFVATLSPQSLASLAERLAFDAQQASVSAPPPQVLFFRIAFAMRELGFHAVMDSTFARHLALREHLREFFERRDAKQRGTEPSLPMLASACPGWICYAEKAHAELLPYVARTKSPQQVAGVLAKRLVGPHLHHAHRGADVPYSATSVYHVAVMPCYDKKLEASRREFEDEWSGSKEVDCVLTTGELHDLLLQRGFDPHRPVSGEPGASGAGDPVPDASLAALSWNLDALALQPAGDLLPLFVQQPGSSSGGYLFAVMHEVWRQSAAELGTPPALDLRVVRNADHTEFLLRRPTDGHVLFKAAQCYGFRNLQNLVRKLQRETGARPGRGPSAARGRGLARRGRMARGADGAVDEALQAPYDYVEVMACPGGCVNGGGQMRPPPAEAQFAASQASAAPELPGGEPPVQGWQGTSKKWVHRVEHTYWGADSLALAPTADTADATQRADALLQTPESAKWQAHLAPVDSRAAEVEAELQLAERGLLRTEYHGVEPETNGLSVQW